MIGGVRLGIVLRDGRLAAVAVAGRRVREAFTLAAEEHPAAVLGAELDARKLKARKASLALPRDLTTVKILELPPAVGGSVAQMVAFELERHLPFPAEDAAFDFLPLPSAREAPQRVVLVASERRTVERALRVLEDAGLAPRSLTVACHDLVALLARRPRTNRAVWAHGVGKDTELLFLEGNRLHLSRSVLAREEAELANEIRKSLGYLGWDELHDLWVSGDGAEQLLGSAHLASLGIPATPPPLSRRARSAAATLGDPVDGLTFLAFGTALGPRRRPLNLLPEGLRPRQVSWAQVFTAANFLVAALLGIGLLLAPGYKGQRHLSRLNQAIRNLDPDVKAVERLMAEVEGKRQLVATLQSVRASALRPLPVLKELTELIPSDAWLSSLTLEGKGVEIAGQAIAANQLIPLLEGSPRLEKVEFTSPVTKGRDKEQFRIKASWESQPSIPAPPRAPAAPRGRGARSL